MDNTLMIGLSRQLTLRRDLDITANNIANMNSTGFKLERPLHASVSQDPARHAHGPADIQFVHAWSNLRDFSPGPSQTTGRPLDVAITDRGFFQVKDGEATRYTRDGRFTLDEDGRLTNFAGLPVLDDRGGEIVLPLDQGEPQITKTGAILFNGNEEARLGVVDFDDVSRLQKVGEGLFSGPEAAANVMDAPALRQGATEGSNVRPILEMTRMIEITRSYTSVSKMIKEAEDQVSDAIRRLSGNQ